MADGDVKAESLSLTVKDQSGGELQFKVKHTTKFGKVCSRQFSGLALLISMQGCLSFMTNAL